MLQVVVLVLSKLVKWRGPYGSSASSDSIWGMISTGKYLGSWIHSVCLLQPMEGLKVPYKSRKLGFFSTSIERILVFVQFVLHPMAWTPNGFAMAGELLRFRIRVVSWAPWSQVSQVVSSPVGFVVMTQLQDWVINSSTWSMTFLFLGIRTVTSLFVVHSYSFMHVFNFVGETVRWLVFPSVHMRVPNKIYSLLLSAMCWPSLHVYLYPFASHSSLFGYHWLRRSHHSSKIFRPSGLREKRRSRASPVAALASAPSPRLGKPWCGDEDMFGLIMINLILQCIQLPIGRITITCRYSFMKKMSSDPQCHMINTCLWPF